MVGGKEPLKSISLRTHRGKTAMARIEFRLSRPSKDGLAQRHQALGQRLRRDSMAGSTWKDGIAHDSPSIEPQAHAAGGVAWYMNHRDAPLSDLYLHAVYQREISFQAKSPRISRMDAYRDACGLAHCLQRTDVVGVAMGQQDATSPGPTYRFENSVSIFARIHDGQLTCGRTLDQITIHGPGTYLQTLQL